MTLHDEHHDPDDLLLQHESRDTNQRHSIDLSLELERQLDSESLPNSPAHPEFGGRQSLDPAILASLVTQLRLAAEKAEQERDEFAAQLGEAKAREASLKDTVSSVSERCAKLEDDLEAARAQNQADQDQLTLLRGNIEESRRALMRLQKENRRASGVSNLDLSAAGSFHLGPPSSRRSSFVPLTGTPAGRVNSHRRISSVSEPGTLYGDSLISPPSRSPQFEVLSGGIPSSSGSNANRRMSGFFGRAAPLDLTSTHDASEVAELRKELATLKDQLEETRHELSEAREAQEASETCANALRTFISENSIGMQPQGRSSTTSAPPAPSSTEEASGRSSTSSRWGFKLWNTPSTASTPAGSPALPPTQPASVPPPLTRKLGGFFTSRASISSQSSISRPEPHLHQQEPMFNGSDSSSLDSGTEPVSPASELPPTSVLIHSDDVAVVTGMSRSPEQMKSMLPPSDLSARLG